MTQKPPTDEELDGWEKRAEWLTLPAREIIKRLIPALRGVRQYASEVWTFQERIKALEEKIACLQDTIARTIADCEKEMAEARAAFDAALKRCHGERDPNEGGW